MNFENIDDYRVRAKVINGWIVETIVKTNDGTVVAMSSCFVPDPNHEWILEDDEDCPCP